MKKHKRKKYKRHTKHFTFTIPLATMPLDMIHIEEGMQEEDSDIWNITPFQMYMVSQFLPEEENKE